MKREYYEIKFKFTTIGGLENLKGILGLLRSLGDLGASRTIGVLDEDHWNSYFFDGDGPDKIRDIKIKKITEKKFVKG